MPRSGKASIALLLRAAESELEAGLVENQLALAYLANGNATRAREVAERARDATIGRGDDRLAAHLTDTLSAITLESGCRPGARARGHGDRAG